MTGLEQWAEQIVDRAAARAAALVAAAHPEHDGHPPVMTPEQAAGYLQISVSTVHRHLVDGLLPGVRLGGRWRLSRRAIDQHLTGQQQEAS